MHDENSEIFRLENFIKDEKYKRGLIESANYYPWVYSELQKLKKLEMKLKDKMKIPLKSTIRFENHRYFSAFYWDNDMQKTRRKFIGKSLLYAE